MKPSDNTKNILSFLLRVAVSVVLLALVFKFNKIDLNQLWSIIKTARVEYMALAFLLFIFNNVIILGRWFVFIRAMKLQVSFFSAMRWFFIGLFCNLFLPSAIGGDIVKTIGLCRETPEKPKVFASVLLDRLSGFAGIVVVAAIAFIFGSSLIQEPSIVISIVIMTVVSLGIVLVLFNHRLFSFAGQVFRFWPKMPRRDFSK